MRGRAWHAVVAIVAGGCIDIPPFPATSDAARDGACTDCDGDGWPEVSVNPDAADCNDRDQTIHPGAVDDPMTPADEDCLERIGPPLAGVSGGPTGLRSGELLVELNSDLGMPSAVGVGGTNILGSLTSSCLFNNEEGIGIALYPAFGAHLRTPAPPTGTMDVTARGPAIATADVQWSTTLTGCSPADATITGNIRFMVLPGGRLIRHDAVTLASSTDQVAACDFPATCGAGPVPPILTSFFAFQPWLGSYEIDNADPPAAFPTAMTFPANAFRRVCVTGAAPGDPSLIFKIGMSWKGTPSPLRLRLAAGNPALVYDWSNTGTPVPEATYEATTAMFVQGTGETECTDEMWVSLAEYASPPRFTNMVVFRPEEGTYVPSQPVTQNRLAFAAMEPSVHGFAVRVDGLGEHGVTVWRNGQRVAAGIDYLVQAEAPAPPETRYFVYFPSVAGADELVIAGPGGEPPPP